MVKSIKNCLEVFLQQQTWQQKLLCQWPTIVGLIADHVLLESIQGSVMFLVTESASWMQEMHCLRPIIIAKVNAALHGAYICDFKLRNKKRGQRKTIHFFDTALSLQQPVVSNCFLSAREESILKTVQDKELQEVLKKFRFRCINQDLRKKQL